MEGAQASSQRGLQLVHGGVSPAVSQRGSGDVGLSGTGWSQQQTLEALLFQERRHLLQEVTFTERAQLLRTMSLERKEEHGVRESCKMLFDCFSGHFFFPFDIN